MAVDRIDQAVLRGILESPKEIVIFALDRDYRYLAFNENHRRTMEAIWGVQIEVGRNMLDYIARDDDRAKAKQNFDRALRGEHFTLVEEYGDEGIDRRYYEDIYSPIRDAESRVIGLAVYLTDITEQRRNQIELEEYRHHLEELVNQRTRELEAAHAQLLHAQKLESVGMLAGGVAHDFNNYLAVIRGCAEIASRSGPSEQVLQQLRRIQTAAEGASKLTDQLLAYSGRRKMATQPLYLNHVVRNMRELLDVALPKGVALTCDLETSLPAITADPVQLQQVVMNLITNAAEAIDTGTGEVAVRTTRLYVEHDTSLRAYSQEPRPEGEYVCLEVEDDGRGMSAETEQMMFDPYFTSKYSGRGLGLAAVYGIVNAHGGAILVDSELGQGTLFRVLFPPSEAPASEMPAQQTEAPFRVDGDVCILVVDDDDQVRHVIVQMVEMLGARVLSAPSGRQACELARARSREISLVLLDFSMPEMGGAETLNELKTIDPDMPVIILSGYPEGDAGVSGVEQRAEGVLHKPLEMQELSQAIARARA